jgi:tetratricopeptide (TPR) repeat protein
MEVLMNASTTKRCPLVLATLLCGGLLGGPALAAGDARSASASAPREAGAVAELNEQGAAFYAARDYRHAIEKFIQAYAVDSDPNLLFNIARCYEELGEVDAAIEKYETFVSTPGADAKGRQRASESLSALRQSKLTPRTPTPVVSQGQPAVGQPSPGSAAVPADSGSGGTALMPWLTLGGGVVFAAAGATFYVMGAGDHSEVEDANGYGDPNGVSTMTRQQASDLVSAGDTKKLIGGIGMGVGGALLATYVVMLLTGDLASDRAAEQNIGFSLSPADGGGSAILYGSF